MNRSDVAYMRRALALARRHIGRTAPNPAVGAVVVSAGRVVGEGAHIQAGEPHAEVVALRASGSKARGATLYVTLEPCNHYGRTPPCCDAILAAGIRRVVIGCPDPSSRVHGKGIARLRASGLQVDVGVLADQAEMLIADFRVWSASARPFVIQKTALTLDGATASRGKGSEQITDEVARRWVHRLRARVDAVLVGGRTARLDEPDLRPRLVRSAPVPWRVVVATRLPTPTGPLSTRSPDRTWWIVRTAGARSVDAWRRLGSRVDVGQSHYPGDVLKLLWSEGVYRLLLEGGATLNRAFLDAGLVDRIYLLYGAKLAGGRPDLATYGGAPTRPLERARPAIVHDITRLGRGFVATITLSL